MVKFFMTVKDEEAGAVIGKNGDVIKELRELTVIHLVVENSSRKSRGHRILKLEGSQRSVEFAKHLVKIRLQLHASCKEQMTGEEREESTKDRTDVQTAATILAKYSNI